MGPPTVMENNKREICFFNLLFPEALSIEIATKTNEYTRKHIEATPNKKWYPTNPEENFWKYQEHENISSNFHIL
jgi:hypothetical protein